MAQPVQPVPAQQPAQPVAFYTRRPVTLIRVLYFIAAVCMFIAALTVCGVFHIGPWTAWLSGGLSAWLLTGAV